MSTTVGSPSVDAIRIVIETLDAQGNTAREILYDLDVTEAFLCEECGAVSEETADSPLYECGDCGTVFNRNTSDAGTHRCNCGKFASKIAEMSCVECDEGAVEPVRVVECPSCQEPIEVEEFTAHYEGCR